MYPRGGAPIPYQQGSYYYTGFANTWIVNPATDLVLFPPQNSTCMPDPWTKKRDASSVSTVCNSSVLFSVANTVCQPLLNASVTNSQYVDVTPYFQACLYDVCVTGNTSFAQSALTAYQDQCQFVQSVVGTGTTQAIMTTGTNHVNAASSIVFAFAWLIPVGVAVLIL